MRHQLRVSALAAFFAIFTTFGNAHAQLSADPIEPQTRGPVHEAFLQPIETTPAPGMPVPKEPPRPIRELPPDEQADGKNVQWIPGYWAWDADKSDYLWISGFWRDAPPGRQYVPGYWTSTADGWRWVQGYWTADAKDAPRLVPEPPAPLATEPSVPAPDDNSVYVQGSWLYRDSTYAWRPGFWTPVRPGLVWVPARYLWTPAGWVFLDGYWDLPLDNRGLLFAPVCFSGTPWLDPGWTYTPSYVVNVGAIFDSCFYRPRSGHFYFGDWYGPGYVTLGFRPWFHGAGRYDPSFSHYAWQQRSTPNWFTGYRQSYTARAQGTLAAPPRTFAQQSLLLKQAPAGNATINGPRNVARVVTPLGQFAQTNKNVAIVKTSPAQVATHQATIQRSQQLVQSRQQRDALAVKSGPTAPSLSGKVSPAPSSAKLAPAPGLKHTAPASPPANVAPKAASPSYVAPKVAPPAYVAPKAAPPAHVAPKVAPPAYVAPKVAPPAYVAPKVAPPAYVAPKAAPPAYVAPKAAPPTYVAPKAAPPAYVAPKAAPPAHVAPKAAPPAKSFTAPKAALATAPKVSMPTMAHSPPRAAPASVAAPRMTAAPAHHAPPATTAHPPAKSTSKHH